MLPLADIIYAIIKIMGKIIADPIFILLIFLVGFQYYKLLKRQDILISKASLIKEVSIAALLGIIGGFVGSLVLTITGITLTDLGILYLWILALILMTINSRYICFCYGGGIISLVYLFFGWPKIDIPQLMGLIAVLHLVESILIVLSGWLNPVPAYIENRKKEIVKGYSMQKFWPIPLVGLLLISGQGATITGMIETPQWWPLIKPAFHNLSDNIYYQFIPVFVALGYGDIAITNYPRKRSVETGRELFLYSTMLLALAIMASYYRYLTILPVLFAPLAHEYLILRGQKRELEGKPFFGFRPVESTEKYLIMDSEGLMQKLKKKFRGFIQ